MSFPWLTVFLPGKHATSAAKKVWTEQDVQDIVTNTQKFGAERIPFTYNHPDDNLPIVGFFNKNDIRVGSFEGMPSVQVKPAKFANGEEGFRSIAKSSHNKPSILVGIYDKVIKHIGLVEKPAVKDVPSFAEYGFSAAFAVDEHTEELTAEFAFDYRTGFEYSIANRMAIIADFMRTQREAMLIADGNSDRADKILPIELIDSLNAELPMLGRDLKWDIQQEIYSSIEQLSNNSQTNSPFKKDEAMEMTELEAKFTALETKVTTLEQTSDSLRAQNTELLQQVQTAGFREFANNLCHVEKKITPGEVEEVVENLQLRAAKDSTAKFSEGEKTSVQKYKESLQARNAMNALFSEIATGGRSETDATFAEDDKLIDEFNKKGGA